MFLVSIGTRSFAHFLFNTSIAAAALSNVPVDQNDLCLFQQINTTRNFPVFYRLFRGFSPLVLISLSDSNKVTACDPICIPAYVSMLRSGANKRAIISSDTRKISNGKLTQSVVVFAGETSFHRPGFSAFIWVLFSLRQRMYLNSICKMCEWTLCNQFTQFVLVGNTNPRCLRNVNSVFFKML